MMRVTSIEKEHNVLCIVTKIVSQNNVSIFVN